MFFLFFGNYFFIVWQNWLYQFNNQKEKKGKKRKVDNLWVDDFFGKIIIFCVVFILGDIIKIFLQFWLYDECELRLYVSLYFSIKYI